MVSRTTAVAAYDVLVEEGVLVRRSGSGTFVVRRPVPSAVCEDPLDCVRAFFDAVITTAVSQDVVDKRDPRGTVRGA
jgi:DNA-binding GntR family transcriptional regulator